jgi:NAD(P)-dependent dehydrogenase (short-subunit alcohol dehydrogenase family)
MSALITGGGGGLGRAVGLALAARDVPVALLDKDLEAAERAAHEVTETTGTTAVPIACDVTRRDDIDRAWDRAQEALGPVEIVVNGAGWFTPCAFTDLSFERWQSTIALQLTGPFHLCQRAAEEWIPAGTAGAIVNISSIAAKVAQTGGSADYGATKAGLLGLTTHLAIELGQYGIRTNAVLPGTFRTQLNAARLAQPGAEARVIENTPLRRIGAAEEVAATVAFLALDGTYVNGAAVPCDGGTIVRMY